jgi:hypothetical protein
MPTRINSRFRRRNRCQQRLFIAEKKKSGFAVSRFDPLNVSAPVLALFIFLTQKTRTCAATLPDRTFS